MNRTELKKIISDFNAISSRLINSDYYDYIDNLKRFHNFIESTEIINSFIQDCGGFCAEMEEDFDKVCQGNGYSYFAFSLDPNEETSEIYSLAKILCNGKYKHPPQGMLFAYSHAKKFNDMLKVFNQRVMVILVNHIENFLKKVGIGVDLDGNVTYNINGNQVNIANDNATINATQNNGLDADKLKELISEMRNSLSDNLPDDDKQTAIESIDAIEAELQSDAPNEKTVKTHFKLLKKIDSSVKFASACCSIATFANKLYPFLDQIALMFQG